MFHTHKFNYFESQDFNTLPEYQKLSAEDQKTVIETYDNAYHSAVHLGQKIAMGKAFANAKALIEELGKSKPPKVQPIPKSIFAGIDE